MYQLTGQDIFQAVAEKLECVFFLKAPAARFSHRCPHLPAALQEPDLAGETFNIAVADQEPGFTVDDHFGRRAFARRYYRLRGGHRLEEHHAKALFAAWHYEDVTGVIVRRDLFVRDPAGDNYALGHRQF